MGARNTEADFWNSVDIKGENECWLWKKSLAIRGGYGQYGWKGKIVKSHRLAWELTYDVVPADLYVCHSCDTPACVNPNHLFLGTAKDNNLDCVLKGRQRRLKLTRSDVIDVRRLYFDGIGSTELGKRYGVIRHTIVAVALKRSYRHIIE